MWRHPEVSTVILRPCNILGPMVYNSFKAYLQLEMVPTLMGFDPMVQVIHEDDVVDALILALHSKKSGIYNLPGPGEIPLSEILKEAGADVLPIPHLLAYPITSLLWRLDLVPFPPQQIDYVRYIWTISGKKIKEELGFQPEITLKETLRSITPRWK